MKRTRLKQRTEEPRLGRRCLIASAVVHLLLVLLVGSQFLLAATKPARPVEIAAGLSETALPLETLEVTPPPEIPPPDPAPEARTEEAPPEESLPPEDLSDEAPAPPPPDLLAAIPDRPYRSLRVKPLPPAPPPPAPAPVRVAPAETASIAPARPVGDTRAAAPIGRNRPPVYPPDAASRMVEGSVLLAVYVDETGSVERIEVLRSSGHPILDREAVRAVSAWRFTPGMRDGRPVPSIAELPVRFVLP